MPKLSEVASDCDDSTTAISPVGTEQVNGIDDDCDGQIDEGTTTFDDDGDGFVKHHLVPMLPELYPIVMTMITIQVPML